MSCVRPSGRGEAVLACEMGVFVKVGPQNGEMCDTGRGCSFRVFAEISMSVFLQLVAICMGLLVLLCFVVLCASACWWFSQTGHH